MPQHGGSASRSSRAFGSDVPETVAGRGGKAAANRKRSAGTDLRGGGLPPSDQIDPRNRQRRSKIIELHTHPQSVRLLATKGDHNMVCMWMRVLVHTRKHAYTLARSLARSHAYMLVHVGMLLSVGGNPTTPLR